MNIFAIVLQVILALDFIFSSSTKLTGAKISIQQRDTLRIAPGFWTSIGGLELLAVIGLFVGIFYHPLAAITALALLLLMIGAFATHILRKDTFAHAIPPLVNIVLATVVLVLRWSDLLRLFGK